MPAILLYQLWDILPWIHAFLGDMKGFFKDRQLF